jgi:hypothetical protein
MEVLQTILMVIGAITLLWLVVKCAKGCLWLLGELVEAGFRGRFPYDYKMHFSWIISELVKRGYAQAGLMDAGSDYPGMLMRNEETGVEMEIRLRAPLFSDKGYSIIVSNHNDKTAIVMQDNASEENKLFLVKFLEK